MPTRAVLYSINDGSMRRDKSPQLHQLRTLFDGHLRDCIHLHSVRDG